LDRRNTGAGTALRARGAELLDPPRTGWEDALLHATVGANGYAPLQVRLLAPEAIILASGAAIALPTTATKLLALLALEPGPVRTGALLAALWPDVDRDTGRRRLKVHLHRIRSALGDDERGGGLVTREHDALELDASGILRIDVREFERSARS